MDVSQYLGVFLDEAKEHIQNLNDSIMQLEEDPTNEDCINEIFRAAHSMKGMAGTMGYKHMQQLTHDMEDVFSDVRNGTLKIESSMIDTLFQCLDAIQAYVDNVTETQDEGDEENANLIQALADIRAGKSGGTVAAAAAEPAAKEAEPAAEQDDANQTGYNSIKIDDSIKGTIEDAQGQGKKIYGLNVKVQESCILKAARAFLVFKGIEEVGEIVASEPSTQDIEDEKFEFDFSLIISTEEEKDKIKEIVLGVSEIESCEIADFDPNGSAAAEKEAAPAEAPAAPAAPAPKKEEASKPAPAPKKEAAPAAGNNKKAVGKPVVNRTVRVDIEKLDVLMNLVSELIIAKNSLISAANTSGISSDVNEQIEYLESVTTNLHESVMKVRMVPIESVLQKFPRMIRDLNKSLGKKMELTMTGEDTEMDRTVVDEIGDPLMHLLRNSADHGIENDSNLRAERGKPEVGQIFLHAFQDGNSVVIEVGDDGNGIDAEAVKNKAIEKGIMSREQADTLTEKQAVELLFHPGFSTAKQVSEISGRGVGLDVVKSKVESLSGEVDVKTKLGEGSTWIIRLPLTLAIIQALMVVIGDEKYAIPLDSIQSIEDISPQDLKFVENKEVINLRGNVTPIVRLNEVLDIDSEKSPDEDLIVVITKKGEQFVGLVIDELMGQQEIVIKPLGKYINKCKMISGATILGDGEIALILDTNALV
ncbi:MAG: chemotaxis protein CheA [Butyrivibrio sp.]|nr:chemotaxis protein CheA [Butyrivibrio sp.]